MSLSIRFTSFLSVLFFCFEIVASESTLRFVPKDDINQSFREAVNLLYESSKSGKSIDNLEDVSSALKNGKSLLFKKENTQLYTETEKKVAAFFDQSTDFDRLYSNLSSSNIRDHLEYFFPYDPQFQSAGWWLRVQPVSGNTKRASCKGCKKAKDLGVKKVTHTTGSSGSYLAMTSGKEGKFNAIQSSKDLGLYANRGDGFYTVVGDKVTGTIDGVEDLQLTFLVADDAVEGVDFTYIPKASVSDGDWLLIHRMDRISLIQNELSVDDLDFVNMVHEGNISKSKVEVLNARQFDLEPKVSQLKHFEKKVLGLLDKDSKYLGSVLIHPWAMKSEKILDFAKEQLKSEEKRVATLNKILDYKHVVDTDFVDQLVAYGDSGVDREKLFNNYFSLDRSVKNEKLFKKLIPEIDDGDIYLYRQLFDDYRFPERTSILVDAVENMASYDIQRNVDSILKRSTDKFKVETYRDIFERLGSSQRTVSNMVMENYMLSDYLKRPDLLEFFVDQGGFDTRLKIMSSLFSRQEIFDANQSQILKILKSFDGDIQLGLVKKWFTENPEVFNLDWRKLSRLKSDFLTNLTSKNYSKVINFSFGSCSSLREKYLKTMD